MLEGSGGGGIVPWATLAGYDSRDQVAATAFYTRVNVDDFQLDVLGASLSFYDRIEISIAQHKFDVEPLGAEIKQNIYGLKYRIYGDVVYSDWPQVSVGLQHKVLDDGAIAAAVGADNADSGTDFYIAATKVHLGGFFGYNTVWNTTLRATKANQTGLLGFGQVDDDDYEVMFEGSLGVLLSRHFAVGIEYRQKPDNLGLGEDDWKDVFIAWIPSKDVNVTLAYAKLGSIAGVQDQNGLYLSISGQIW
ncbi:hypothetical protein MACH26_25710 [Planctobacterium marinum]|uniref:DUF3034 family protein n=2 Tax=Planctobacterium marinum TaxID=1631968 RepID=A0AA48I6X1_9ALTE|nr:hypothetical protein MACH26_25710 [Planctobacterium marinum]